MDGEEQFCDTGKDSKNHLLHHFVLQIKKGQTVKHF